MAKVRVYELAKELGVTSKELTQKLSDMGEFVRSASSTIEPPVVRRLRDEFPAGAAAAKPAPAKKAAPAQPPSPTASKAAAPGARPAAPGQRPAASAPTASAPAASASTASAPAASASTASAPTASAPAASVAAASAPAAPQAAAPSAPEVPAAKAAPASSGARPAAPGPRPTPNAAAVSAPATGAPAAESVAPAASAPAPSPARPDAPGPRPGPAARPAAAEQSGGPEEGRGGDTRPARTRPGNNPFATSQGMPRPGGRNAPRPGGPQGGPGGPRPGNNPFAASQGMPRGGARPGQGAPAGGAGDRPGGPRPPAGSGGPRPNPGMMPGRSAVGRPGAPAGRPGAPGAGRGRPGGGGGAAGRPGGGGPPSGGGGFGKGARGRGGTQGAFGRAGGRPVRGRKSKRAKRQEFEAMSAPSVGGVTVPRGNGSTLVRLRRGSSLTDFAEKIDANPASLVTVLFALGEMATVNQSLDEETFKLLGAELGYDIQVVSPEEEERELFEQFNIDLDDTDEGSEDDLAQRPPVVTVMGHVDHGKTRLLDAIRSANVMSGEAGGITQHIGAYQVVTNLEGVERPVTFIDTPGHEAFTAMRARGAKVTDIAVLVVAADDGVMPQTIEALNHAQSAGVPIVVAVNKIDKEGANPDKVMQQLTEYNLVAEEYGGDTMFVQVSAREKLNIDKLLEAILLTADAALELTANPTREARGVAIEAHLDKGRGASATVLVQTGTLHVGDAIVAGGAYGRVRAMLDDAGNNVFEAPPSFPVLVLGLQSVPGAGDTFVVAPDDRTARQIAERREAADRAALLAKRRKRISLEDLNAVLAAGKVETLNLIIKGDVSGSVEALEDELLKVEVGDDVELRIIHRGVGAITQNDVNLATVDDAVIIGFNVRPAERVADLAEREGIDMRFYSVIYQAIEEIEAALKGMLKPEYEEVQLGSAEVREVFRSSKFGNIAGCIVRSGLVRRNAKARLVRDGNVVAENLAIDSLRRFKDDATEVREGYECGIGLGSFNDIKAEDMIETYEIREKARA